MDINPSDTAIVFIDPQNDVLSEKGVNWDAVGASVVENNTVENMERIFKAAKEHGYPVFISPHYFYPTDSCWIFNGPLEADEFRTHSFARTGALDLPALPPPAPTGWAASSPISRTAGQLSSARTRCGGRRPTT
jgi:nicotinamidase-related amidase